MTDLIDDQVGIRDRVAQDEGSAGFRFGCRGKRMLGEVGLKGVEEAGAAVFAVFGVGLVLVVIEESDYEECAPCFKFKIISNQSCDLWPLDKDRKN